MTQNAEQNSFSTRTLELQISALTKKVEALSFWFGHGGNNHTVRRVKDDRF